MDYFIKKEKGEKKIMLVSICCLSYNHKRFIRNALNGILKQKVKFTYEILIHDDASTDGTKEIIQEYVKAYPHIIKPIYQIENQYSKGKPVSYYNYNRAKGKYIAFCECDDCWIDENKLQKQIDFLENNNDYFATTHNIYVIDENNKIINYDNHYFPSLESHTINTADELNITGGLCGQTATIVTRNFWEKLSDTQRKIFIETKANGDRKFNLCMIYFGKIKYFEEIMSAYRVTYNTDSWRSKSHGKLTVLDGYYTNEKLKKMINDMFNKKIVYSNSYLLSGGISNIVQFRNKFHIKSEVLLFFLIPDNKINVLFKCLKLTLLKILRRMKLYNKIGPWRIVPKLRTKDAI